jgi:hypothetical protein
MPVKGGSPREVVRANSINDFQCAWAPASDCIMAQLNGETTQLSTFDPKTGVVKLALTILQGAHSPKNACVRSCYPNETKSAELLPAVPPGNYH